MPDDEKMRPDDQTVDAEQPLSLEQEAVAIINGRPHFPQEKGQAAGQPAGQPAAGQAGQAALPQQEPPQMPAPQELLEMQLRLLAMVFVRGTIMVFPQAPPQVMLPTLAKVVGRFLLASCAGDPLKLMSVRKMLKEGFKAGLNEAMEARAVEQQQGPQQGAVPVAPAPPTAGPLNS